MNKRHPQPGSLLNHLDTNLQKVYAAPSANSVDVNDPRVLVYKHCSPVQKTMQQHVVDCL